MQTLFAASFEGTLRPNFDVRCLEPGQKLPDGWGIGYYPAGELAAAVLKEAAPSEGPVQRDFVATWDHLASPLFLLQLRTAHWGPLQFANTQPLLQSYARRDWLFAHAGSLARRLERPATARFEPVGSTDSEEIFCELLERLAAAGWRSLLEADLEVVKSWLNELSVAGDLTSLLCDGRDLLAFAGRGSEELWLHTVTPPVQSLVMDDADLSVDLTKHGPLQRRGVVLSSVPLQYPEDVSVFRERVPPGGLLAIRQGVVVASLLPSRTDSEGSPVLGARWAGTRPAAAEPRLLEVRHRSVYRYASPVEHSVHLLRVRPAHDRTQRLVEFTLDISVPAESREYEDVFGNQVRRFEIRRAYTELSIDAWSRVRLLDADPLTFQPLHVRSRIPLVWMPWQREVLAPFLLPPELPESELRELSDYAMSFVERNDSDLLDTLLDMNMAIHKGYRYTPGSTTLATTPYEVYLKRRGVCQDFANLMICMARLLGVPARYACGYVYCGPRDRNRLQSEASHAWIQVYLPEHGWTGFDPTNGVLTQTSHVRVASGRSSVDATPTSGTLYAGGGGETLEVEVTVEQVDEGANSA